MLRRPIGRSLYDEDLTIENIQLHFGLFIAEDLVACVIALPVSATEAKIRQMAVSHKNQAQGFGRIIIAHLESELARRGCTDFHLHSRISAAGFYQKLGYVLVDPEFTEIGIPHVRMQKSLT